MTRRAVFWTAIGSGIAAVAVILFLASGFRLFAILTPSMGQTAPVGTLVVSHSADTYQPGDIISFERISRVYTHRIVAIGPDGITTKGDLNGAADPMPTKIGDVIGKAVFIAPGFGWVLRALPWLVLGAVVVWLLSILGRREHVWRWVIRISGWTLVFALAAVWLRPWINLDMLGFTPAEHGGGVMMHVVNTGLFPLDANGTRLVSGQDAVVHVTEQNAAGFYTMSPAPALDLWQRIGLLLVCLLPLAASFLVRPEDAAAAAAEAGTVSHSQRRRRVLLGAVVVAVVVSVAAVNQTIAYGSYAAVITNSTNTAGLRSYFNCRNAITSLGKTKTYVAFAMGTATTKVEPDLSGNTSNDGAYNVSTGTLSTSYGCKKDLPRNSVSFNGTSQCLASKSTYANPQLFSLEAWFNTSSTKAVKVIGFGTTQFTPTEGTYDRHVYVDNNGRVLFGIYTNTHTTIASPSGTDYSDGNWHHVVATYSGGAGGTGMKLYLDSVLVATGNYTNAENTTAYWKVGCGNLANWPNAAGTALATTGANPNASAWFSGQIQYAAVYSVELSSSQVVDHYQAGQP